MVAPRTGLVSEISILTRGGAPAAVVAQPAARASSKIDLIPHHHYPFSRAPTQAAITKSNSGCAREPPRGLIHAMGPDGVRRLPGVTARLTILVLLVPLPA